MIKISSFIQDFVLLDEVDDRLEEDEVEEIVSENEDISEENIEAVRSFCIWCWDAFLYY